MFALHLRLLCWQLAMHNAMLRKRAVHVFMLDSRHVSQKGGCQTCVQLSRDRFLPQWLKCAHCDPVCHASQPHKISKLCMSSCRHLLAMQASCSSVRFGHEPVPRQWVSWGKQATKKGSPTANQSPVPKIRASHTPQNNNQKGKPKQVNKYPQPLSTMNRTGGPHQSAPGRCLFLHRHEGDRRSLSRHLAMD